jgi:non-specific protein-tyrosine kinase
MELKQYAALILRWLWLIILATVLAAGAAFITSTLQTPTYEASTSLLIDQAPSTQTSEYTGLLMSERLAKTYAQLITDPLVLEQTSANMGDGVDIKKLENAISVELVRDTQIIDLIVEYPSAVKAAEITNTLAAVFIERNTELQTSRFAASKENLSEELANLDEIIQETRSSIDDIGDPSTTPERVLLERLQSDLAQYQTSYTTTLQSYENLRLAEAETVSNVVQLAPASVPTSPIRPQILMNTVLAGVVGAMLAVGVVFLIEYLDDTVKSTEEVCEATGLPIIGFLAKVEKLEEGDPVVVQEPRSPLSEAFRSLRTNIEFASVDRPIQSLLITSPGPEVGKSTVAANLALVIAQGGKKVVLLDADMRRPRLHRIMDLHNKFGLSDFFRRSTQDPRSRVQHYENIFLDVVTSGKLPPNPAELLGSFRMAQILEMFKGKYTFVVIDSPPVGVVTDPTILSASVDATLLVIEPKKTKLAATVHAVEQLHRAGANVIGMVFNNVPVSRTGYYTGFSSGYYYYQYAYSYKESEDGREPLELPPFRGRERRRSSDRKRQSLSDHLKE